jgi:hypothetical protein
MAAAEQGPNVQLVAPALTVSDIERSLAFYIDTVWDLRLRTAGSPTGACAGAG